MQKVTTKITYTAAIIFAAAIVILSSVLGGGVRYARAAASERQSAYESVNVLDDLLGATVGGKAFDLADYPFDENAEPQVILFSEFCYGSEEDYALYVYVYNPSALNFNTANGLNKIQFKAGSGNNEKYVLQEINHSERAGSVRLFYKFKIDLTETQRETILAGLDPAQRIYATSGIELFANGTATEYDVVQVYTYAGYAKGYGADKEISTLTCKVDGLEKFIRIDDLHFTSFRPGYSNGTSRYTQDSLTSVYFAIPKNVTDEYGIMSRIRGEYLKALTGDVFVTGDASYYQQFYAKIGKDVGKLSVNAFTYFSNDDFPYTIKAEKYNVLNIIERANWTYHYPVTYNYPEGSIKTVLNYVLYANNGNAADYTVSSAELKKYMLDYTKQFGGSSSQLVGGKYSADLFEWVDESYTQFDLTAEDKTQGMISQQIYQTWWNRIIGSASIGGSSYYDGKEAIHAVTDEDFIYNAGSSDPNEKATCDNLYIGYSDYAEFKAFYDANKEDSTVYIIRFAVDNYISSEATIGEALCISSTGDLTLKPGTVSTNGYVAQEYVYLNFDVIDFNFTKNNVTTEIPCIMSPVDIITSITPPPDMAGTSDFWVFALCATLVLIVVIIVSLVIKRKRGKTA